MFGLFHRRRRRELVDQLWNSRLHPTSTSIPGRFQSEDRSLISNQRRIDGGSLLEVSVATYLVSTNVVGPWSTSSGTSRRRHRRDVTTSSIRRLCSCLGTFLTSNLPINRFENEADDDREAEVVSFSPDSCECSKSEIMKDVAVTHFFDLLDNDQLESLVSIVGCGLADDDGDAGGCIQVAAPWPVINDPPHIISCRLWRWPEVSRTSVKPMPCCWTGSRTRSDSQRVTCCNPFHWSRVLQPAIKAFTDEQDLSSKHDHLETTTSSNGSAGPSRTTDSSLSVIDCDADAITTGCSLTAVNEDHDDNDISAAEAWCTLAYWEHDRRVGPLFDVRCSSVDIFDRMARGTGLCLSLLDRTASSGRLNSTQLQNSAKFARRPCETTHSVQQTRNKIGPGLVLSLEQEPAASGGGSSVWVYNRSRYPAFIDRGQARTASCHNGMQPTDVSACAPVIEKLPAGFSTRLFDDVCDRWRRRVSNRDVDEIGRDCELTDDECSRSRCSINHRQYSRISFVKGWGPGYHRTNVTSCPCWLEVLVGHGPYR